MFVDCAWVIKFDKVGPAQYVLRGSSLRDVRIIRFCTYLLRFELDHLGFGWRRLLLR